MNHVVRVALLAATCMIAFQFPASADTLPLKRVVVTTSGLALYEHQGIVDGNRTITLPVRLDRVDDLLKSLMIMDAKGSLSSVSLPGREPLDNAFRDLPFTQDDLQSTVALLNTLRGATVEISGKESFSGKLMNVVAEDQKDENSTVTRHRISVLTSDGIRSAVVESLGRLKFTDNAVQAQLDRALQSIFSNRIKDQRAIDIELIGEGSRDVALAYIEDAPLWKSSYRLVLSDQAEQAMLQGWAVLENTTGQDWQDVGVTLMSGSPVTYRQSLYQSYNVDRPELPVKVMDRLLPRVDRGAMETAEGVEMANAAAAPASAPAPQFRKQSADDRVHPQMLGAPMAAMRDQVTSYVQAAPPPMVLAEASADQIASQLIFAFPQPVSLPAGHTMMLPFVSRDVLAEKAYVYQPETNARHPLVSVSIQNDTGNGLPPGILTLFDRSKGALIHVGDAEMPLIPRGENRFISFALDSNCLIDRSEKADSTLGLLTIASGSLRQKRVTRAVTNYTIKAPAYEGRTIVLELPRRKDWTLEPPAGTEGATETTETHYRIAFAVKPGETRAVQLALRREGDDIIALTALAPEDIDARILAYGKDMSPALKDALETLRGKRRVIVDLETGLKRMETEHARIVADQSRLRDNLQTVSPNNELGKRYLKQMEAQEDRLAKLESDRQDFTGKLELARRDMSDFAASLNL